MGHSRPREIGESGSPSIWVTFSSWTYTFWPQPTAQYGQTDFTTRSAEATRGVSRALCPLFAAAPRPSGSVPVSWRYTGQESIQVRTPTTNLLPLASSILPRPCGHGISAVVGARGTRAGRGQTARGCRMPVPGDSALRCVGAWTGRGARNVRVVTVPSE